MSDKKSLPYGSWKSPITADFLVQDAVVFQQIAIDGEDIYWVESRPNESGRYAVVKCSPKGNSYSMSDVIPNGFSARTLVHEYGGGSITVHDGVLYFSNNSNINNANDQRLYCKKSHMHPVPITPEINMRYADGVVDKQRNRLICVQEDHAVLKNNYPVNTIVSIDIEGKKEQQVLVSGNDFYSSPALSPDGKKLAFITWNNPHMPWDSTELWVCDIDNNGLLINETRIAGISVDTPDNLDVGGSIFQPQWSPDGVLYFVCDRNFTTTSQDCRDNWWSIYRFVDGSIGLVSKSAPQNTEFGDAQWNFGMSTYTFLSPDTIIAAYNLEGDWRLAKINTATLEFKTIDLKLPIGDKLVDVTDIHQVRACLGNVVFIAATPYYPPSIILLNVESESLIVLKPSRDLNTIEPLLSYISTPISLNYPTGINESDTAHGFYYPPLNADYQGLDTEKPPLMIKAHGGPTGSASTALSFDIQYFTSRGFGVVDINYRGSTGFGRNYRLSLYKNWGIYDRDDCISCAKYLSENDNIKDKIDINRVVTRGGSAGGYLTLVLTTFTNLCKAGASYYGISDLEILVKDTHKFEAQYPIDLIGPVDMCVKEYKMRSPIYSINLLECPMIFFQGLQDKVVPPEQTEKMVEVLKQNGKPVEYMLFENEQHGFRIAENIKKSIEAEFLFYSKILGFKPAD